jgi:uncharacterized membrane protein
MLKPNRLAAFCDGVIAIAITLLVLGLEVPSVHEVPDQQLSRYLYESLRPLIGYVSSFILVGTYWLQHFAIFHYVKHADRTFVVLNGIFLLSVSFVPFPTGIQATYRHDELAMILYAGTQVLCGLSLMAIWTYATKNHRLVVVTTSPLVIQSMRRRIALTPIVGIGAIAASFWSIDLSRVMFLVIPISQLSHRIVDEGWIQAGDDGLNS